METIKDTVNTIELPAIAMRGLVIFPSMVLHFDVERAKSIAALERAMASNRRIFMTAQKDVSVDNPGKSDLYKIGVVAEIKQLLKISNDAVRVLVEGIYKAKMLDLDEHRQYLKASVVRLSRRGIRASEASQTALRRSLLEAFTVYCEAMPKIPQEAIDRVVGSDNLKDMFDAVIQNVVLTYPERQKILELSSVYLQCEKLVQALLEEAQIIDLEQDIMDKVKERMDQNQNEYFLREQMRAIAEQLGEGDGVQEEAAQFEERIIRLKHMPEQTKEKLLKECDRLCKSAGSAQEAGVIRTYLETCLSLPWDEKTTDIVDMRRAKKTLDKDHYGMEKVKERILESLAVRKLTPDIKSQILCFVGPPGVGKTSIAKAVAQAMGRRYQRISLGGVRDEADIRGHRKTYVGAMQGRIINAYIAAKSRNPLILLDEIDKMSSDFRGDPSAAMLEVLDGEQNNAFVDHYIEVPFDLSDTLFITTANTTDTIPAPLLDRMEIIELSSYTREEKFNIAKKHLVKKQRAKHGLSAQQLKIADSALYDIIDGYIKEAGVRRLEQKIAELCRKSAKMIAEEQKKSVSVSSANIEKLLGKRRFLSDKLAREDEVGVVNGLAWTSVGGELLKIEAAVVDGTGKIDVTGNLGKVMTESAKLAVTYARSVADLYGIDRDFYKNYDIHIHAPEGAVPKDGPSAGVTMTTALISALTDTPVRRDIAMTGEISLRGRVMPIGGLKEKSMAAYAAGIRTVLIPKGNLPDLQEIDKEVKAAVKFIACEKIEDVLDFALVKKRKAKKDIVIPTENKGKDVPTIRS